MTAAIKLEIISDIVCPWCIIGYQRVKQAIEELGIEDAVEIEWQHFELNPDMPAEGENLQQHIIRKYGSTPEHSKETEERIAALGEESGFHFDFYEDMRIVNTRDAHVLLDYAKQHGRQTELKLRLFSAYFSERKDISDRRVLAEELQRAGLDSDEVLEFLNSDDAQRQVEENENFWRRSGVLSVPTMVFNRTSAVTGAQPVEVYKQLLTELIENENTAA